MPWITSLSSIEAFRTALKKPEDLFLAGYLRAKPTMLTAATLLEEVELFMVGNDQATWRAKVFKEQGRPHVIQIPLAHRKAL